MSDDFVQRLAADIKKEHGFDSVEYAGPSKNYVFFCTDKAGEKFVFKSFHIHEERKDEDLSKAFREIAFHQYAGPKFRLPEMISYAYTPDGLGINLLTRFKKMKEITPESINEEMIEKLAEKLEQIHEVKPSTLNPGLRARINEENLRKNEWLMEETRKMAEQGIIQNELSARIVKKAENIIDNPLLKQPKVLCHGDARLQNFYIDENGTVQMRDFEHANINSPLLDAASLYASVPRKFREIIRKKVREKELAGDAHPKQYEAAFDYLVIHRAVSWLVYNLKYAKKDLQLHERIAEGVAILEAETCQ